MGTFQEIEIEAQRYDKRLLKVGIVLLLLILGIQLVALVGIVSIIRSDIRLHQKFDSLFEKLDDKGTQGASVFPTTIETPGEELSGSVGSEVEPSFPDISIPFERSEKLNCSKEDGGNNNEPKNITWVAKSGGEIAPFAVQGNEGDTPPEYVVRAPRGSGMVVGRLRLGESYAHVAYGFKEYLDRDYEVMTAPLGTLSWTKGRGRQIPLNAVIGGMDSNTIVDNPEYYIGRVRHNNVLTIGKVHRRYGQIFIAVDGKEYGYEKYEILVRNMCGQLMNV